jgi:anti-sigma B factor antagonist
VEGLGERGTVTPLVIPEIVALPAEIDISNAGQAARDLRAAFRPGVTVVIGDLSATRYCDSCGARSLLLARDAAAAAGAALRLVIPPGAVLRMLTLLSFDSLLQIYPTLQQALAASSSAADPGA